MICSLFFVVIHTTEAGSARSRSSLDARRARGNGEFAGRSTGCGMTFLGAMWCCTRSGTGRKLTNHVSGPHTIEPRSKDSRGGSPHTSSAHFPASSRFTASLTTFPSTRMPAPEKRAIAFFITVPMSFIVGEPISAMVAFTPAAISASPAALGR
jgi:hypothetical protein